MPSDVFEIVISEDGRYVDASPNALELLGLDLDELRAMPLGSLTGNTAETGRTVWRRFVDDNLPIPPHPAVRLRARGGDEVAARFLGTEPGPEPGTWVSRYRLVSGSRIVMNRPMIMATILAQWREAERRLAALAPNDPARSELEATIAELKALHGHEERRRSTTANP